MNEKLNKLLFGAGVLGSLALGASSCSSNKSDDKEEAKTEVKAKEIKNDPYGNVALFESSRSDIKFALSFVENHYNYVYWCGEAWTTGSGLTILYNADGTYTKVTQNTKVPTHEEADVYKGRYLTFEILPDIEKYITVPMDKNTLIAACVLRYCIGHSNFINSSFVKQLNAGKKGAELAKTLTGWRQQQGVPNRCYFFAALMAGEIEYSDLLDLRAEGCYNLTWKDMFVYNKNGQPKADKQGFYEWDFSKVKQNLEKAKKPRAVVLNLGKGKGHVKVNCELTKDIVPNYVWQDVSGGKSSKYVVVPVNEDETIDVDSLNDAAWCDYQANDYDNALQNALLALKYAKTDKQRGAAHFNMGMAYMGKCKYGRAKACFEKSLAVNKTKAAQDQLNIAQEKLSEKRGKAGKVALGLGLLGAGVVYGGRKYYLAQQQKKGMRR